MISSSSPGPITDASFRQRVRRRLLAWFARHHRDLPWRRSRDPYRIWISEVMLQQTQVATVAPYFERFLRRFPTLAALARASEQEVLRFWQGLGYYRRALHLHQAARQLVQKNASRLPDDPAMWRRLPGVGRYILGAVLSQAFDRRLPILEANSERVLCRLFARKEDPRGSPGRRWLWQAAQELLPTKNVGNFNQALMELGALVCTPREPQCRQCPLAGDCRAKRSGRQATLPVRSRRAATIAIREVAVVLRRGPRVLLVQRPDRGRWARMWEFPRAAMKSKETGAAAATRALFELTALHADLEQHMLTIRHSVTHHRIMLTCWQGQYRSGQVRLRMYRRARWLRPEELSAYPLSTPQRRIARALVERLRRTGF